jgi:abortive infection bacteriophage resistance protein
VSFPPQKREYQKSWLSLEDQVTLLQSRGLIVANRTSAIAFLSHINYYRFSGYCLAFEKARHEFLPGTTFEQVQSSYQFDRNLRDIVTEALEVIELDVRTSIAFTFGKTYGPFGHTVANNFYVDSKYPNKHQEWHTKWLDKLHEEAARSSELFVTHFQRNYREFPDLPIWIVTEVMSFGGLSQMFNAMRRKDHKLVAARYNIQPNELISWMHHMVYVRNLCAHHSRLWDRIWSVSPTLPYGTAWKPPLIPANNRLFATLLLLNHLLTRCPSNTAFGAEWRDRVVKLLTQPPACPNAFQYMGLTPQWHQHPLWK